MGSRKKDKETASGKADVSCGVEPITRTRAGEVIGLVIMGLSILLLLSLYSYHAGGPNWIGPAGEACAELLTGTLGYSSYIATAGLAVLGLLILLGKEIRIKLWETAGYALLALAVSALMYIHAPAGKELEFGGVAGMWIGKGLELAFAEIGATILLSLVAILALFMTTNFSIVRLAATLIDLTILFFGRMHTLFMVYRRRRKRLKEKKAELARKRKELLDQVGDSRRAAEQLKARLEEERRRKLEEVEAEVEEDVRKLEEKERAKLLEELQKRMAKNEEDARRQSDAGKDDGREDASVGGGGPDAEKLLEVEGNGRDEHDMPRIVESPAAKKKRRNPEQRRFWFEEFGDYQLPGPDLLDEVPDSDIRRDPEEMYEQAKKLEDKLADYGVKGKVIEIHPGPVVTMYEYKPGRGVRVSQIANLDKDLAMALEAKSIRIVAPIPGKSAVGIEVPNKHREIVYLKEIITSDEFVSKKGKLVFCLGKDIRGMPVVADIEKMPHLLIAGTTGSGKSVMLHSLLLSILFRASPDDVRMIIVDPKMVDMITYEGIPHLLLPVVTDMKKASQALEWAVEEMERRYALLAKVGARNINTYNKKVAAMKQVTEDIDEISPQSRSKKVIVLRRNKGEEGVDVQGNGGGSETDVGGESQMADKAQEQAILDASGMDDVAEAGSTEPGPDGPRVDKAGNRDDELQHLPYLLVIVDEFAELMALVSREVETSIQRLAQKARAAGIHLVLATQRPDAKVITGVIKANFPSRIAFRVQDQTNSRVVLDQKGAESLLGMGDMLYLGPGSPSAKRCHGAYVSEEETQRLVDFLKKQGKPTYNEEILRPKDEDGEENGEAAEESYDEKYDEAVRLVTETRKASISWVQRQLQVGYNRAARMIERMEREGIVSPPNGSKGRQVLAPPPPK